MEPRTREFISLASATIADPQRQKSLQGLYGGFHQARINAAAATQGWEDLRDRGRAIKAHVVENLDHYLEMAARNVENASGKVFFAKDAASASDYVLGLARARGVRTVIKGKSMISEEMGLNHHLEASGIEAVETDLGEYLIQLAGQTPYHIIAPAIHMSRQEVSDILHEKTGAPRHDSIEEIAGVARRQLREKFIAADMGITGANFVVAETGTLVLVTNEGNGRMSTSMPPVHVAIMGMEKIVPSMEDLGVMLRLLIRSATGQRLSSYVTTVTGPRRADDEDGPEEFHLVIVDNGRSKLLADPQMREALYCLRCGACLNACPVYRKVGGHAYGWVYSGPIGAIVSPVLTDVAEAKHLPFASSLCGACREVCPVRINIPRMLLHLRHEIAEGGTHVSKPAAPVIERVMMRGYRATVSRPSAMRLAGGVGRLAQSPLARNGRIRRLPPPLSGWTRYRTFPTLASRTFRARWKRGIR
ncbi:MAG: iron-sulfur cluster-binding protein [SAR202 cluster bacterium]|nr:iron-sulfur cluster-binding protein [SAR202 cluster bacterium]